ncbi:glutamate 5-kinase [Marinomonas mediterranea]|jgi:glutamate 5-kinase (EC 2.7.2.11)|uniref:Glutamate 5-kinase n=1 Tax=Marinomonas mediterranea (strain ATCC 700492 / JCM 21426 / NBRC 103028 / MMB-1) TaxID=717774 RepID=F2JXU6_MARM1|nr:glutamate 5-kinase [Marinomonas mediterranea]ADZ89595.1 Glutamate 5-kinase [Marinomonas mediterranea MMB-1]WCN07687.1 glutamate 5-kinase [Marinomonas mediterranea]WCN11789.1 glutamate 5-kinase [Marinomonas mediterranea]WCN15837.1 glutamate 5-kinase [Marinomonas mediterranea MMB-1]
MDIREKIAKAQRVVVKIGSALLTNDGQGLDVNSIGSWVEQIAELRKQGKEVVLVSSGSIAAGMKRLGFLSRPTQVNELQAAAAVGQMELVGVYESHFERFGLNTAQILLTHDDLSNRRRYLNARSSLRTLLGLGVVPIVNENDTVVTDEIRFGDNDTLGALVANLVEADLLLILTDQNGLYDKNPRDHKDATLISHASASDERLEAMASGGAGVLGSGGMLTKVRAAKLAARSGADTLIASGREVGVIVRSVSGEPLGTWLLPDFTPLAARKQWLAGHLKSRGALILDEGAVRALRKKGTSLLPVGVKDAEGSFARGDMVICVDEKGGLVARGLVNYSIAETLKLLGKPSSERGDVLGYEGEPELIHRDDLVMI